MVVNFNAREISLDTRKLIRTLTLIIKKKDASHGVNNQSCFLLQEFAIVY